MTSPGMRGDNLPDSSDLYESIYQTLILQVEQKIGQKDTLSNWLTTLMIDADSLAKKHEWISAIEILKTVLEFLNDDDLMTDSPELETSSFSNYPSTENVLLPEGGMQFEAGFDYSLQEFELTLEENDSILSEELNNPYVSFLWRQVFSPRHSSLTLNHQFRMDSRYWNYFLNGYFESGKNLINRAELNGFIYQSRTTEDPSFWDAQLKYAIGEPYDLANKWIMNTQIRYKKFLSLDSLYNDLLSVWGQIWYEHFYSFYRSLSFVFTPELYKETASIGYRYAQFQIESTFRLRRSYRQALETGVLVWYKNFRNQLDGDDYRNQFYSVIGKVDVQQPLYHRWGWEGAFQMEVRRYEQPDEVSPDFYQFEGKTGIRYFLSDFKSFGLGFRGEKQVYSAPAPELENLVKQGDYFERGVYFAMELMNLKGLLLDIEYIISWKDFPHAEVSPFYSYYSNRYVHSLSAIGWIPLGKHWQVQLMANYDNDRDRELEHNDNRNTILNVGFIYKF